MGKIKILDVNNEVEAEETLIKAANIMTEDRKKINDFDEPYLKAQDDELISVISLLREKLIEKIIEIIKK